MTNNYEDILTFWFTELTPSQYFERSDEVDAEIVRRFGERLEAAAQGAYEEWAETPQGRLALIILLDQFSRNVHRDSPKAFAADERALSLTRDGIAKGDDIALTPTQRHFFYMPLMHAEDAAAQKESVAQFAQLKKEGVDVVEYAKEHKDTIDRFGRFPYRNEVLGRETTAEELEYLQQRAQAS